MKATKLQAALEKIITLTSEKDSNALELALAQTLFTLADVKNMAIYSASDINRAKYARANDEKPDQGLEIPEDLIEMLDQCLVDTNIASVLHLDKRLTLFPLMCSKMQSLAVIVVEEIPDAHNHDLAIQILKIYHNFLALINDNERDILTGLLNRKTFNQKINALITELQQDKNEDKVNKLEAAYLAIFDIDHFKRVNDTHGHLIGDEVLLLFSQLMDKSFRGRDLLFRFGGEEFIGVFQGTSDETMSAVLNRFREVVANYSFPQAGKVTISCGFTKIEAVDQPTSIIDRADVALYHAKNSGRNQAFQHEQLIASGVLLEKK